MSLALAVIGAALAALFALVDSALLRSTLEVGGEAPAPRREAEHRALAFARVLAQLGTGAAVAAALGLDARPAWQAALAVVALGLLAVAVTETAARELGDALGARGVEALLPIARAAVLLLSPVVALAVRLDEALLRALPPPAPDEVSREETAEQFREIVAAEAEVTGEERALLAGVFAMGDTQVSEVMVPRVDVVGVERTTPWSEVVDRVRASEHSRIPVYDETIDDVVGVLYAKDVLTAVVADAEPAPDWTALVRPTDFIPTTKHLDAQLRDFRASGNHMAIVVDEFGGTAGIVTIEDVLEEIVGEIRDERDDEEAPIEREGDRRFWVSSRVSLDELSEALGHEFVEGEDVATVGGLIYHVLGRVPRAGERLVVGPFRVVVERVVRRKIQRVYFERVEAASTDVSGLGDDADGGAVRTAGTAPVGDARRDTPRDAARAAARPAVAPGDGRRELP
jgi:CBS domain containing-hemolysin-like protein